MTSFDSSIISDDDIDDESDCYYYYDHGTGRHILENSTRGSQPEGGRNGASRRRQRQPPKYSFMCICCNLVDWLIFAGCIAFLYFAVRFAFYLLENYGAGDGGND
mmetsp:Transcript_40201/g.84173  ORF Transcript_40201/g.84173 Transcript_40201/m.84173 type:complete len:105 (+) Transcript_40201:37-351(+)